MNSISFFKALLMKELNEKDLPGNQEKIAGAAEPKDKITAADFAALRAKNEGEDHEVSMAQNSLKSIISSASQLMNMLGQDEKDIPAWIQDHITNAENYINQASKNYHEYHNGGDNMDELPVDNEEEPVDDMTLQSMMEAKFSLKDFSKNLELHKKGNITKSQLITSYNKLNAKDQDKAKELAKGLDVLPNPKKINETSLKSMMESVVKRKKEGLQEFGPSIANVSKGRFKLEDLINWFNEKKQNKELKHGFKSQYREFISRLKGHAKYENGYVPANYVYHAIGDFVLIHPSNASAKEMDAITKIQNAHGKELYSAIRNELTAYDRKGNEINLV